MSYENGFYSNTKNAHSNPWLANPNATASNVGNFSLPQEGNANNPSSLYDEDDFSNEPPLLEELGIHFDHIWVKTQSVLNPMKKIDEHILDDTDLAGPLVFCFLFGVCLLLSAKVHFGYIYGFGVLGCGFVYLLMNLMSQSRSIDIYRVCSVLGYCLLPIIALAFINILFRVK